MIKIQASDSIRAFERESIRSFVQRNRRYLKGRVLDFGCGRPGTCAVPEPYRDLIEGEYVGVDKGDELTVDPFSFDAILCTQVLQYIELPFETLEHFWFDLKPHGHLVMTYPTNWDEVESSDLWRFTKSGMEKLLKDARFEVLIHERRAEVDLGHFTFPIGYGVVARKC